MQLGLRHIVSNIFRPGVGHDCSLDPEICFEGDGEVVVVERTELSSRDVVGVVLEVDVDVILDPPYLWRCGGCLLWRCCLLLDAA